MNSLNDWEKARREEELNQELKRQNNLLEQQRWEQQFSNQKQQAALDEQNRLAREQKETLKERNELERQRQWDEESRHQREIELRIEQQYKDNIFDLKKLWAKAESEDERGRIQILLAEAETEYDEYLLEKERELERKRLAAEQFQLKQQEEIEQNELLERRRQKISRIKWFFGIAISLLLLAIIGTFLIGMSKSKSSYTHNSNNHLTQPTTSETSTSSTTKSSPSTSKSQDKQTSTTSPTTRPQATRVYIGNFIGRKSIDVVAELKEKKVPENLIKIVEEESSETEAGLVIKQSLPEGTTYDLSKATEITLTIAKKVTSVPMPSYIGSSLEFTKNNLIQIVGVKEANIEVIEVSTAPEGTVEDTVVSQSPKPGEGVDLNNTRIKISIYKPKTTQTSQGRSR
ncbi:PASTA domain-containing protein [Streptococcus infantis]|nr:PASTA domain-containing protein [Streptococcus infantis]